MTDFISDEEMAKLEGVDSGFISDEDMARMEATTEQPGPGLYERGVEAVADSLPAVGTIAGGLIGSGVAPVAGTVGGGALGYAGGSEARDLLKHYLLNKQLPSTKPVDQAVRVGGNLARGATAQMGGMAAGALAKAAPAALERMATSALPSKISKATDVTGATKNFIQKQLPALGANLPEPIRKTLDAGAGLVGRKVAYSNPVTGIAQGVSDSARVAGVGQKGIAYALDKAPAGMAQGISNFAGNAGGAVTAAVTPPPKSTNPVNRLKSAPDPKIQMYGSILEKAKQDGTYGSQYYMIVNNHPEIKKYLGEEYTP